jgi:hypothetical protein
MTTIDFDPFEARDDIPHELFTRLRGECLVARTPTGWYLARQDDVLEATKQVDTFVSSFREPGVVVPEDEKLVSEVAEPRHGQIRKVINAAVAHHRSMKTEPFVRDLCEEYLAPVLARGHGELVGEFVSPVPINVIAFLIGVPRRDWATFRRWSDEVVEGTYPTKNRTERGEGLAGGHPEFASYIDALITARRKSGERPDDLVTKLIDTEIDGQRLTDVEIRTQLVFLIISGNETTRHLIGNLLQRIVADPALLEERVPIGRSSSAPSRSRCASTRPSTSCCETSSTRPTSSASTCARARRSRSASHPPTATSATTPTPRRSGSTVRTGASTSPSAAGPTCAQGRASRASRRASRSTCSRLRRYRAACPATSGARRRCLPTAPPSSPWCHAGYELSSISTSSPFWSRLIYACR